MVHLISLGEDGQQGYAANLMALGSNVQQTWHMQLIKSPKEGILNFVLYLIHQPFVFSYTCVRKLASCAKKSLFISMRFLLSLTAFHFLP